MAKRYPTAAIVRICKSKKNGCKYEVVQSGRVISRHRKKTTAVQAANARNKARKR